MIRFAFLFSSLVVLFILITGFNPKKTNVKGAWKIETIIFKGDTLYQTESINHTFRFYGKHMPTADTSKLEQEYFQKCGMSTYMNSKSVCLRIERRRYEHSLLLPCWDHIGALGKGTWKYEDSTKILTFTGDDGWLFLELEYNTISDQLCYNNEQHDYQVIYSRDLTR